MVGKTDLCFCRAQNFSFKWFVKLINVNLSVELVCTGSTAIENILVYMKAKADAFDNMRSYVKNSKCGSNGSNITNKIHLLVYYSYVLRFTNNFVEKIPSLPYR